MKLKIKLGANPEDAEISVDGKRLEGEVMGLDFHVKAGQVPHVILVLKPSDVEIDVDQASVTQTRAAAPPAPPAPAPNRQARRAAGKKK